MHRLRVVQVGLGDWGRDWAWRINPTIGEVAVVGYVDSDPDAFDQLQAKVPAAAKRSFSNFRDALERTRPEAVLVTTTLADHDALVRESLEAGLHVLVEKPFTATLASARELVALAAARRLVLMVSQNYRFFPAPRAVASLVADAALGDLYEVSIDFRRDRSSPLKTRWRQHWDPQPLLVDMSIHHFDLMRLIIGREPDRISCVTAAKGRGGFEGPPAAVASILFGDTVVSYRGSFMSAAPITAWAGEWRMEFVHGCVAWTSRGDDGALNDRVVITRRGDRPYVMKLPEMQRIDRAGTLGEFVSAIRSNREPETSGRDNLKTLAMVEAAVESADRLDWVLLAEERR